MVTGLNRIGLSTRRDILLIAFVVKPEIERLGKIFTARQNDCEPETNHIAATGGIDTGAAGDWS